MTLFPFTHQNRNQHHLQTEMKIFIKNMVCSRCIMVVKQVLKKMKLHQVHVELGVAEVENPLNDQQLNKLSKKFLKLGFEILDNQKEKLIEEIKNLFVKKLQEDKIEEHFSVKTYLSSSINKDYSYLSRLFSETERMTIEHYFILLKLEKVKELISYGEHTLNEIAWRLGYSSVQHLSTQFKKVVGISTTTFKNNLTIKRKAIDQVAGNK